MAKSVDLREGDDCGSRVKPSLVGSVGDHRDTVVVPGLGVLWSKHKTSDMRRNANEAYGSRYKEGYHEMLLDEDVLLDLADQVRAHRELTGLSGAKDDRDQRYAGKCHEGTDAEDPRLQEGFRREGRNSFRIDRSQSSVSITTPSCGPNGRFLNGSAVRHANYVSIQVNAPSGRRCCEVSMSFDQFAAALVSRSNTSCTLDYFTSIGPGTVGLEEVVHEPDSIPDRMKQRLADRLDAVDQRLAEILETLDAQIETKKPMSMTNLSALRKEIGIYREHASSNRDFTVEQADEEIQSIVEQAMIQVRGVIGMNASEPAVAGLLGNVLKIESK